LPLANVCRPSFSADWGDYISFASHLRAKADAEGSDLLLIDTGDRVEGNGLFDASDPKGKYYYDIYKEQDIDIICSGNHELYKANSSNAELHQTVPNYKNSYISSNLDIIDPDRGTREPLAPRFRKFETKNQKLRILAFGFLYDFTGNADNTIVQPVEETVKEDWFKKALEDREVDVIIVIGHVGIRMNEFSVIHHAIRSAQWDIPVLYFGGHVHVRDYTSYDRKSASIASGRYLETIGFMSIDGIPNGKKPDDGPKEAAATLKFARRYIDNNLFSFQHHSGKNASTFSTEKGKNVTKVITKTRASLHLSKKYGCAPNPLYVNRAPYPSNSSIFSWLADSVFPKQLVNAPRTVSTGKKALVITNTGAIRFDIFEGPFTLDTEFLVSPFTSGFRFVPDVPLKVAGRVLELLNGRGPIIQAVAMERGFPGWMLAPPEQLAIRAGRLGRKQEQKGFWESMSAKGAGQRVMGLFKSKKDEGLKPGYTTIDDLGSDGDDTEHAHIDFFNVPNVVQATVGFDMPPSLKDVPDDETVDLVYTDFVQPWIIMALQYLGLKTEEKDTAVYYEGKSVTNVITDWIHDNWKC
jgi:2',3'-cyclic-nucleotide 2'-phosphodiesterase (5'-nucleotidase family)